MTRVLVLAPHPDDEVLGVGGAIIRHVNENHRVGVVVVSEGVSAQYSNPEMLEVRRNACRDACKSLGVEKVFFHDLPDARLQDVGLHRVVEVINSTMDEYNPKIVYAPDRSELHIDHRVVHEAALVVTRPYLRSFQGGAVYFYETSPLKYSMFRPNYYVDITTFMDAKINAFKLYASEIEDFPHPRSLEAIKTLGKMRGAESGLQFAEGFVLGRAVW